MSVPYWTSTDGRYVIYHGDCLEVLPQLGLENVSLVCTDPPYHGVKNHDWDNQWKTDAAFLLWVSQVCGLIDNVLAFNGSLYWFSSPQMAARVECEIAKKFNVLNHLVWSKGDSRGGVAGNGIDVTGLRQFWSASSERIIFAERYGSDELFGDSLIDGNQTYRPACESTKRSIFGDYLKVEFQRAGVTQKQVASLFPSVSGKLTGCVSNWLLGYNCPTLNQYELIRQFLNVSYSGDDSQYLRREYEDLRREYEDLRRPFNVTARDEWGDVWRYPIERKQVHPTQKPLKMIAHIVKASSCENGLLLDPFMGSGTTGIACVQLNRQFIGIEVNREYCDVAIERIESELAQAQLFESTEFVAEQLPFALSEMS